MARKRPRGSAQPSRFASGLVEDSAFSALDLLRRPLPSLPVNVPLDPVALSEIEDRREFGFGSKPVRSSRRWTVRAGVRPRSRPTARSRSFDMQSLMFYHPKHVIRCVRRKIKKEVLHALGKTGKGSGWKLKRRKYRRNDLSNVRC